MAAPPTGTVTFLFTDIEGSTALWERHAAAMRAALSRHDAILKQAFGRLGGHVFSESGDGFGVAFASASSGLRCAVEAQQALAAEDWPTMGDRIAVRMGIHTGHAELRDGNYFGPPLNRAARLMSAAHGQQIVLSLPTEELVRDALPPDVTLIDLGEHRLRDLGRAERVFEVAHPALPAGFPPLRSLDSQRHNLPLQLTSFVGREEDRLQVASLLRATRLLTLTGMGGSGKTRLALHVAADVLHDYPDGTWFVDLASISSPELVPHSVADVLSIREQPGRPMTHTVAEAIGDDTVLILLDNCEHLTDACAQLASDLLARCSRMRILATSRETLGVAGEVIYRVPPLLAPPAEVTVEQLSQYEAVQLFIDRARAVNPDFEIRNTSAPALASICHRVDGIPLAIELAAARTRMMSVEEIHKHLDDRFRLLTGGSRTAPRRQRTLLDLIDWSYELLAHEEQDVLNTLAVFAGACSIEAAQVVCAGADRPPWATIDLLTQLVDKSLVVAASSEAETRFRLLESVREFALSKLQQAGGMDAAREAHAAHYVTFAEEAARHLTGPDQAEWVARLAQDDANCRAALSWAVDTSRDELALRLVNALYRYWEARGSIAEARSWADRVLALPQSPASSRLRVEARRVQAWMATQQGDLDVAEAAHRANLAALRASGDAAETASELYLLGAFHGRKGEYAAAVEQLSESLAICRELPPSRTLISAVSGLGICAMEQGDYDTALVSYKEALDACRVVGDPKQMALTLSNLGNLHSARKEYEEAVSCYEDALRIWQRIDNKPGLGSTLNNLAVAETRRGRHEQAAHYLSKCIELERELGRTPAYVRAHMALAELQRIRGDLIGMHRSLVEALDQARSLSNAFILLGALKMCGLFLSDVEQHAMAVRLFGCVDAAQRARNMAEHDDLRPVVDQVLARCRKSLGAQSFKQEWSSGEAIDLAAGLDLARRELSAQRPVRIRALEAARSGADGESALGVLTKRELEVVQLVVEGLTNPAIADRMGIAPKTVEKHMSNILFKLDLTRRAQLAAWAVSQGLDGPG